MPDTIPLTLALGSLLALGGAMAGGLLAPLTWPAAIVGLVLVFVVRSVARMIGLAPLNGTPCRERAAVSFFGIRGIGSLYYLAYAPNEAEFPGSETLWTLVGFVVVISVFVHGASGVPVMGALDRRRKQTGA